MNPPPHLSAYLGVSGIPLTAVSHEIQFHFGAAVHIPPAAASRDFWFRGSPPCLALKGCGQHSGGTSGTTGSALHGLFTFPRWQPSASQQPPFFAARSVSSLQTQPEPKHPRLDNPSSMPPVPSPSQPTGLRCSFPSICYFPHLRSSFTPASSSHTPRHQTPPPRLGQPSPTRLAQHARCHP
jgi:hypothetical protein